jgi:hypothetical protein
MCVGRRSGRWSSVIGQFIPTLYSIYVFLQTVQFTPTNKDRVSCKKPIISIKKTDKTTKIA